jgi:hypothetical protein
MHVRSAHRSTEAPKHVVLPAAPAAAACSSAEPGADPSPSSANSRSAPNLIRSWSSPWCSAVPSASPPVPPVPPDFRILRTTTCSRTSFSLARCDGAKQGAWMRSCAVTRASVCVRWNMSVFVCGGGVGLISSTRWCWHKEGAGRKGAARHPALQAPISSPSSPLPLAGPLPRPPPTHPRQHPTPRMHTCIMRSSMVARATKRYTCGTMSSTRAMQQGSRKLAGCGGESADRRLPSCSMFLPGPREDPAASRCPGCAAAANPPTDQATSSP